jgi:hypothetical protein
VVIPALLVATFGLIIALGIWAERRRRSFEGPPRRRDSDPSSDSEETARRVGLFSSLFGGGEGPGPG